MKKAVMRLATGLAAVALVIGAPSGAQAQTSTGVDTNTIGQDLAWRFIEGTYIDIPGGGTLANAWVVSQSFYPGCAWVNTCPPEGDSRWISINPAAGESAPASYTYFHVFDVAKGGILTGQWSSDNSSMIYLNGMLLGTASDLAFQSWHDFSGTLAVGQNVLAIQTTNIECGGCMPNPGGVIANFQSTTVTPEPISMALLGTGLAGVAAVRRRRRKSDEA